MTQALERLERDTRTNECAAAVTSFDPTLAVQLPERSADRRPTEFCQAGEFMVGVESGALRWRGPNEIGNQLIPQSGRTAASG
jgi:hypothetical protein